MQVFLLRSLTREAPLSLLPAISQLAASWHTASLHMENGLQAGMQGCWLTFGTTHKNTLTQNNVVWPNYYMAYFHKILTNDTPYPTSKSHIWYAFCQPSNTIWQTYISTNIRSCYVCCLTAQSTFWTNVDLSSNVFCGIYIWEQFSSTRSAHELNL